MQWLRFSEDGTCQRGAALAGKAFAALELVGRVSAWVVVLQLGFEESGSEEQQEGEVALVPPEVEVVLPVAAPWAHHCRHLGIFSTCCPCCHLSGPAVQCSKAGRVTNAKARIQI